MLLRVSPWTGTIMLSTQAPDHVTDEPTVLTAVLRLLRDVGALARDDEQREEVRRQGGLVLQGLSAELLDDDADAVRDLVRRVELTLSGWLGPAYGDRAGETRSI